MKETLRKLDEVIEQLRRVPDNHVLLAHLELVRHDLMERIYEMPGRRAALHAARSTPAA